MMVTGRPDDRPAVSKENSVLRSQGPCGSRTGGVRMSTGGGDDWAVQLLRGGLEDLCGKRYE